MMATIQQHTQLVARDQFGEGMRHMSPHPRWATLARVTLLVYLFFVLFGTTTPFPANSHNIDDKAVSNVLNQVIYSSLLLAALLCLLPQFRNLMRVLRHEKFLTAFLAWSLLSVLWSDVSAVSFKRIIQLATPVTVILAALLYARESKYTLLPLLQIYCLYLPLSLLAVFLIPGAIEDGGQAWRGMAASKNHFGQAMVVSVVAWVMAIQLGVVRRGLRLAAGGMCLLSLVMLWKSGSATCLIAMIVIVACRAAWWLVETTLPPQLSKLYFALVVASVTTATVLALVLIPSMVGTLIGGFGRDTTFTGRTELWSFVWESARSHLIRGCGYGAFWTMLNEDLFFLYDYFIWLPNQAHMGYLDLLNEVGLIGVGIFVLMLGAYAWRLFLFRSPHCWGWFVLATLIINIQESTLFRPHVLSGVMFIHAYLSMSVDTLKYRGEI